jgi:hypothetical protein
LFFEVISDYEMGHPLTTVGVIIPGMHNTNKNDSARLIKEANLCHDLLSAFCFRTQKGGISVGMLKLTCAMWV